MARPFLLPGTREVVMPRHETLNLRRTISTRLPNWRWYGVAILWPLLLAGFSHAEPPGRIGFFDLEVVLRRTGIRQQVEKEFQSKLQERQKELEVIEREYEQLSERLKLEGASLPPERRKEQQAAIEQKFETLKRDKARYQKELLTLERGGRVSVTEAVGRVVKEIGQEQGYAAILERKRAGLYYLQKELDLTDAIVRRIKEKIATGRAPKTPPAGGSTSVGEPSPEPQSE